MKKYLYDMCLCRCLLKPSRSENLDQTLDASRIVSIQTNTESEPCLTDLEADQTLDVASGPLLHVGSDADYDLTHLDMRELFYLLTFPISFPASYVYNLFQTGKIFYKPMYTFGAK